MEFNEFLNLDANAVTQLVTDTVQRPLGVAIPFNGTRRWYLATTGATPDDLYSTDYADRVRFQMWTVMEMMFADGVTAIYSPIMGRALAERGPEYMEFAARAVGGLADDIAVQRYRAGQIAASCYGQLSLLPAETRQQIISTLETTHTPAARYFLRYGVFADQPLQDLISRTIRLQHDLGTEPSSDQLIESYYGGQVVHADLWIGTDQPTIFDVPLVLNEQTALYFLQFPTLYFDHYTWRRLLFDYLFVRGDEESLHPDNVSQERHIIGLGRRQAATGWQASVE